MANVVMGKDVAAKMRERMKTNISRLNGVKPTLATIRVGEDYGSIMYEKGVVSQADKAGVTVSKYIFPGDISQEEFEKEFLKINADPAIHGILLFRPLPEQLNVDRFYQLIDPEKDMDCMSPANWAKLAMGDPDGYYPCTAEAVVQIIDYLGIDVQGKNVVIINHSLVVGRPLGYMLIARNATVQWCHVFTDDTVRHCDKVDILVSAVGKHGIVTKQHVLNANPNCTVIDVAITKDKDGNTCGDVLFDEVEPLVGNITPVPGGVGSVTSVVMMEHVVRAACKACGIKYE